MDTFTLVTGLASLFGFAIQAFDLFPQLGRARQTVFLILVGVFLGSLLRAIDPSSVKLNLQVSGFTILVAIFLTIVIGFLIAAAFSKDTIRRGEFYNIATVGSFIFFVFLVIGGIVTYGGIKTSSEETISLEKEKITTSELSTLVEQALQHKDFERAIMHLRTIKSRLDQNDERVKSIQEKIKQIQLEEIKQSMHVS